MESLLKQIDDLEIIDLSKSFELAQLCSKHLRSENEELKDNSRKLIIHILNNWGKVEESTKKIWNDLIESAGFYPYFQKDMDGLKIDSTCSKIRKEYHKSNTLRYNYFHEEQKLLLEKLLSNRNLIVSAPTSFGKSLLIQEIVASKRYKNIVIIQPTLALLDETRKKLKKYSAYYKIIVRTSQEPSESKGNLFLLTAERVMEYSLFPEIDFMILDEFYKLSTKRDDERSDTLNNAFNLLVNKYKCRFYLLGPNIDKISDGFAEKFNAEFYKTGYSLVDNRIIDYYIPYIDSFGNRGEKKLFKESKLFELLYELKDEQTIIYCSSPSRVRYLSVKFLDYLIDKGVKKDNFEIPLVEWIEENISKDWSLIECLKYMIGIHDGALQKHITSSIISYFNEHKLNFLFCTSTIIEGVNTSAKNVIYFDATKGNGIGIDYFDYSNIKGRSGRMMVHFIGNVYNFNPQPNKDKETVIDIPFYEQNPVSDEVLIHLDRGNVKNPDSSQYKALESIPEDERQLFKKNGLLIKGQQNVLRTLEQNILSDDKYRLMSWTNYPTYEQLEYILDLAWTNLIRPGETTSPMTKRRLVKVTFDYGRNQNINSMIMSNYWYYKGLEKYEGVSDRSIMDEAIRDAFQILKHWFEYKVPKWLRAISSLQTLVCQKKNYRPGNYTFYASKIENDFVRENLAILYEYGIPRSAIEKISAKISSSISEDMVIEQIKRGEIIETSNLIQYEKDKFYDNI